MKLLKSGPMRRGGRRSLLRASDVYLLRRAAAAHPITDEAIELLRQSGASEYTVSAAVKTKRRTSAKAKAS